MSHQGQASGGARLLRPACTIAAVVVAAFAVSALRAGEPDRFAATELSRFAVVLEEIPSSVNNQTVAGFRPGRLKRSAPRRSGRFYNAHLIPKLNAQFDNMAAYRVLPDPGRDLDELTETAKHRAERGTRRALKNYLLEVSTLGRTVDTIRGADRDESRSARRPLRFDLKISHGIPKVDMRYRLSAAAVRLGVGVDGSVSAEFRRARSTGRTWIAARYDADDRDYNLLCRVSF